MIFAAREREMDLIVWRRGERYRECRFHTFDSLSDDHRKALNTVRDYSENLRENVANGVNLILYGPRGTGKDHLMAALMWRVIMNNHYTAFRRSGKPKENSIDWWTGVDIFGEFRDAMSDGKIKENEIIHQFTTPAILFVSDPLPPTGALTEYQQSALFRIIDRRYSNRKPIVTTLNVASRTELDERLGAQNADRLRHDAVVVKCNWGSYRKVKP